MAGGLNKEFLANPLAFLARYTLGVGCSADEGAFRKFTPGRYSFDIEARGGHDVGMGYEAIVVPFSRKVGTFSHPVDAWWCPYNQNDAYTIDLNGGPRFFFTPMIDGCSLVVGPGNSPTVGHFNYLQGRAIDSTRMTGEIDNTFPGGGEFRWEKANYTVDGGARYTVIGVRSKAGVWTFYAQKILPPSHDVTRIHATA